MPRRPTAIHTDYGKGMSEWCANCHAGFLAPGGSGQHKHPASNTSGLGPHSANYNAYVKTGDLTGNAATSYLALVPFERQVSDPTAAEPDLHPGTGRNIKRHVPVVPSGPYIGVSECRPLGFRKEFLADSHPKDTDTGAIVGDQLASYYGRDIATVFNAEQRSLCNKCHLKD